MSRFAWNLRGCVAYSWYDRADIEEWGGWWRHVAFGLFVYRDKETPGWSTP